MLRQAREDSLTALSVRDARIALLNVAAIPWFEDTWSQGALEALEMLTAAIPVNTFGFVPGVSAVNLVEKEAVA